jgi:hypothetical protein
VPRLRPKRLTPSDRRRAHALRLNFLVQLGAARSIPVTEELAASLALDPELREPLSLCGYAADLLKRLDGVSSGATTLALWRGFAWTAKGSPKKGFVLTAESIRAAERTLEDRLRRQG